MQRDTFTLNEDLAVYTANILPWYSCPGRTKFCENWCYACSGQFTFPSVVTAQAERWAQTADLGAWMDHTAAEVKRLAGPRRRLSRRQTDGRLVLRVHSAGDFYSVDYLRAWYEVAKRCPEAVFYTYTRTWTLPEFRRALDEAPDNFVIWCSVDPTHKTRPDWPRLAFVEGTEGAPRPNCAKQLRKGEFNCTTCVRCHSGRPGRVTFKLH